ncbi:MAG: MBL fold metallo-hydrolase RNA specificity domain-containing protein [Thermoprotei archaeon]
MSAESLLEKALVRVNEHGGISINESIVIDGHEDFHERIVTHVHSDHTARLAESIRRRQKIVGTPLTLEWLSMMTGFSDPSLFVPLDYDQPYEVGGLKVVFKKAIHIPGTAQVLVEYEDSTTIGYTSDFKKVGKGTDVLQPDVLVIDAVYGHPSYVREFDDFIETILADLVNELLSKGPVHLYAYYGKVQEVMQVLRERGVIAPFVLSHKQYSLSKIAEKYGMRFGEYFHINSREGVDVIRSGWYVYLTHSTNYSRLKENSRVSHVTLSGWEFTKPYRKLGNNSYLVAFSDHSDFKGLIEYVERSKPKLLIVNNARSSQSKTFADYVANKLNIKTIVL